MRQTQNSPQQAVVAWLRQAWRMLALTTLLCAGLTGAAQAQDATFKNEELDQMLAPIALYPDSLLAQVLMASTYPGEVKEASDWSKAHPDDKGDAAVAKVESQDWDPSVKSLVAFPQVLAMMRDKPDDVQKLGDAFLADPGRVMDRVQDLRRKAQAAGNLKTTDQQKVSTATEENKQVIIIEPAQPSQVYVPVYQPSVVYGTWPYPAYPPVYWPPPPYYYPGAAFVGGVLWGAAIVGISNGLWGGCNWGGGNVNINVNKFNNVNVNNKITNNNNKFNHNANHRKDVPYRDSKSREQYGQKQRDGAGDRDAYRGKDGRDSQRSQASNTLKDRGADPAAGRDKLQGADRDRANSAVDRSAQDRAGNSARGGDLGAAGNRAGASDRSAAGNHAGASNRSAAGGGASHQGAGGASRDSAFSGAGNSGASRASANRGSASTSSMSRGGGGGGGGARAGGGGGGRGGGGGGGRR